MNDIVQYVGYRPTELVQKAEGDVNGVYMSTQYTATQTGFSRLLQYENIRIKMCFSKIKFGNRTKHSKNVILQSLYPFKLHILAF